MIKKLIAVVFGLLVLVVLAVVLTQFPFGEKGYVKVSTLDTETSSPIKSAIVYVYTQDWDFVSKKIVGENGTTKLELKPGYYYINVSATNYPETSELVFVYAGKESPVEIRLQKKTHLCVENWKCGEWGKCINGSQNRTCADLNKCGNVTTKTETRKCFGCTSDEDCSDNNPCTTEKCVNNMCQRSIITECKSGDGCCPRGCDNTDNDCYLGTECSSPEDCSDNNSCTLDECRNGYCYYSTITECKSDDDCCPGNCDYKSDSDCEQVQPTKKCEKNSDCNDWDSCTIDECNDDGKCVNTQITSCIGGDGCCPGGCSYPGDSDCNQCESDADCDDGNSCTQNICSHNKEDDAKRCVYMPIIECINDDGCCPETCFYNNDNDCSPNKCLTYADCNDDDSCTIDKCSSGECVHEDITECNPGDGCCPSGCTYSGGDTDCPWTS
ncbi:MAG: carboxypeptidase regulatory-like domain-containing protein [Candidatus Diapherotrites archaeon]|nr:carboxypeptidase regulatory-like domain-containing protein [Candidatus Diapherotrites archaeon]